MPPPENRALDDPWSRSGSIPLDGAFERAALPPWLAMLIALVGGIVLFQFFIAPIALVVLIVLSGVSPADLLDALPTMATDFFPQFLVANTIGQFLAIGLPAVIIARFSSSRVRSFLRIRRVDWTLMVLSLLAFVALIPVVQWLGEMSSSLPWPSWVEELESMMLEPLNRVLEDTSRLPINLFMIALTPAICEELLFRGYVQRQAERTVGARWGIIATGVIFGMYHLQPTKLLPLAVLGIYLGYLVWRTGSLLPAAAVHFANNGFAVMLGYVAAKRTDLTLADLESVTVPWYLAVGALVVFSAIVYLMNRVAPARTPATERLVDPASVGVHFGSPPTVD